MLAPPELARRLDRVLAVTERLIAEVAEPTLHAKPPGGDRTVRDLAYHVFRLSLAFADGMDLGRVPREWLAQPAPDDLRDGRAVARYGALVRGRLAGWFEGAGAQEYARTIEVYDGPLSGHYFLQRTTTHAARHLRELHATLDALGATPAPLPADLET